VSERKRLGDRPTPDLVVVLLTICVVFVVVFSLVGAVVLRIVEPTTDLTNIAKSIAGITNTLIGAVVGYLAGRGVIPSETKTTKRQQPKGPS
jgi:hypothetical protein